jgi:hypothetical protein
MPFSKLAKSHSQHDTNTTAEKKPARHYGILFIASIMHKQADGEAKGTKSACKHGY